MENRNKVLLYSNLAIQMAIIIGIGTYFGNYLDESYQNQSPWVASDNSYFSAHVYRADGSDLGFRVPSKYRGYDGQLEKNIKIKSARKGFIGS